VNFFPTKSYLLALSHDLESRYRELEDQVQMHEELCDELPNHQYREFRSDIRNQLDRRLNFLSEFISETGSKSIGWVDRLRLLKGLISLRKEGRELENIVAPFGPFSNKYRGFRR